MDATDADEQDEPVVQCAAWGRLVTVLRALVLAQAAGDVAAVVERGPALRERTAAVGALVRVGLTGEQGHPAGSVQAALLARDVYATARHTAVAMRALLGHTRSVRDAASATVCGGAWWESKLSVPDDIEARFTGVLSLGSGALSRRTGVCVTGSGELLFVGEPAGATDMVTAVAWLSALVEAEQIAIATFTTSDTAMLTDLSDQMRRKGKRS